jgi:hypothetical protein
MIKIQNPNFDDIGKGHFSAWIPAPRLRGDRLSGYDVHDIYLILIVLLSFPRRRESRNGKIRLFTKPSILKKNNAKLPLAGRLLYKILPILISKLFWSLDIGF